MHDQESVVFTTMRRIAEAKRQRKQISLIAQGNDLRRGVTEYAPSQIEGFFDLVEPLGNIIASGGNSVIRCRVAVAAAACSINQGVPVIVLHCGNQNMEQQFSNLFMSLPIFRIINWNNPIYDPLVGLNDNEISQLFVQTGTGTIAIPAGGKYYIEALSTYLRNRGIAPYCRMFFSCPHQKITGAVDSAIASGQIPLTTGQQIKSLIMQGQKYRSTVETFFSILEQQSLRLLCGKSNLSNRISLFEAATNGMVVVFDATSDANGLLLNILAFEIERILANGIPLSLIVDDISLPNNEKIANLFKLSTGSFWRMISTRDLFSMVGSNDEMFANVTNCAHKLFISSHLGIGSSKWAQCIGEYDKEEITQSFATTNRYSSFFSVLPSKDNSQNITIAQKREQIFKAESISRFAQNEFVIVNRPKNEIAHTFVI